MEYVPQGVDFFHSFNKYLFITLIGRGILLGLETQGWERQKKKIPILMEVIFQWRVQA